MAERSYRDAPLGPQPTPTVVMQPLGLAELVALCGPAKLALGVTVKTPDGALGRGWQWRAYRSIGFAYRARRKEEPERWAAVELVSLRLRRDPGPGDAPRAAVLVWTRPVVHLRKATLTKRQVEAGLTRPPARSADWSADGAWLWSPGVAGSIPRDVGSNAVKTAIREDM